MLTSRGIFTIIAVGSLSIIVSVWKALGLGNGYEALGIDATFASCYEQAEMIQSASSADIFRVLCGTLPGLSRGLYESTNSAIATTESFLTNGQAFLVGSIDTIDKILQIFWSDCITHIQDEISISTLSMPMRSLITKGLEGFMALMGIIAASYLLKGLLHILRAMGLVAFGNIQAQAMPTEPVTETVKSTAEIAGPGAEANGEEEDGEEAKGEEEDEEEDEN